MSLITGDRSLRSKKREVRFFVATPINPLSNLDELAYTCQWATDFLSTNAEVSEPDRHLRN